MIVIPAIDLMGGRCVRLTRGDFETSVAYSDDPLETARGFEDAGVGWLHVVDLDGARTGKPHHFGVLESIKTHTDLHVDFGGGLRNRESIAAAFERGADQVTVGSAAIRRTSAFAAWLEEFGPDRLVLAADVKEGRIAISGWTETSSLTVADSISEFVDLGLSYAMVTDISKDGTLEGPSPGFYADLKAAFPDVFLIASGGVGSADDLAALWKAGCDAAIVGKALYEGYIALNEVAAFSASQPPTPPFSSEAN